MAEEIRLKVWISRDVGGDYRTHYQRPTYDEKKGYYYGSYKMLGLNKWLYDYLDFPIGECREFEIIAKEIN